MSLPKATSCLNYLDLPVLLSSSRRNLAHSSDVALPLLGCYSTKLKHVDEIVSSVLH